MIKEIKVMHGIYNGLGNRIKCLVSGMLVSDSLNAKLSLYWVKSKGCNCSFTQLFENRFTPGKYKFIFDFLRKYKLLKFITPSILIIKTWHLFTSSDIPKLIDDVRIFKEDRIDLKYENIPIDKKKEVLKYFNQLIPKKFIKDEVEKFSKKLSKDTKSFAIRSWVDCPTKRRRNFNFNRIFKIMDSLTSSNFFVSCDSDEVLKRLIKRYGSRILYYPHKAKSGDRNSQRGIQEALIDILILSKSNHIFATKSSTFSEVAWWFGGCKAKVSIIEDYFPNKTFKNN